jgi:periplasmic protein TonB
VRQSGVRFLIIPQWDLMEDEMFVDSLLESSPYPGHRPVWSKLVSTLVQAAALAIALAIPLFHIERIQILPPPPSIRMTSVQQPAALQPQSPASPRVAPAMLYEVVQPSSIPSHIARVNDRTSETGGIPNVGPLCTSNCGAAMPITNIISAGQPIIGPPPRRVPSPPVRVSEMQLGEVVRKVLPEYPIVAKQLRIQGAVLLLATIGRDGRVEHVEAVKGPPLLVQPAMRAVEQWKYRPYVLNREAIEVQTQITVNFVLNRE